MNEQKVKNRAWVKNAAIVFLIIMLVLTFFSNTIMNRALPEVAAANIHSGTITARIRGTGIVEANENFDVVAGQRRTVSSVNVRLGEEVSVGDVLITLVGDESEELAEAEEKLHSLEVELERMLLHLDLTEIQQGGQWAEANRNIQRLRNRLAEEEAARNAIGFNQDSYNATVNSYNYANEQVRNRQTDVNNAQASLDSARAHLATFIPIPNPPTPEYEAALDAVERNSVNLANATAALANAQTAQTQAAANLATWEAKRTAYNAANDSIRTIREQLEDAIAALAQAQREAGIGSYEEEIDIREKQREISEQEELIDKLRREGVASEIVSVVDGIVKTINVTSGAVTDPEAVLMVVEVVDRGYSVSFVVTAEQAARLTVGDNADVDRGWWSWGETPSARLVSIRNDPQNPVLGRVLVFDVSGDIESGTQLNISIAQRSENYSNIVPNSAIRTDTNGDFVLMIMSQTSPLGNRYIATRFDVQILARDDVNTAVSGAFSEGGSVITTTSAPVEPGSQVRLVDNP